MTVSNQTATNFDFLSVHDDLLVKLGTQAERYAFDDPPTALVKLRQFAETLARRFAARIGTYLPGEAFSDLLYRLDRTGSLSQTVSQTFHTLRRSGNAAAHESKGATAEALQNARMAWALGVWFHQTSPQGKGFQPTAYVAPIQADHDAEIDRLRAELAAAKDEAALLAQRVTEAETQWDEAQKALERRLHLEQAAAETITPDERRARIDKALTQGDHLLLDEAETRRLIDEQLRLAGWDADSLNLTFAKGVRPEKGRNIAIAEWPTATGPADYVLFAGLTPVGVVEAKKKSKDVAGAIDQAKRYSLSYTAKHGELMPRPLLHQGDFAGWPGGIDDKGQPRHYRIPFVFATNGRPYMKQFETASGIWFWDARRTTNARRPLTGWMAPQGLQDMLDSDQEAAESKLKAEPTDYLGLRDYQLRAIAAVEEAIVTGHRRCLLAMATGTGKTKTVIGLVYRLLKSKRFRRVLFLVDRESLGEQAQNAFHEMRLEQDKRFADIYDVKELGDITPDAHTRVHVATVQSMVRRIFGDPDTTIPVDRYDCIIVDESHRGYNLDRDMGDGELHFRDFTDYVSLYRRVLDHFDAVTIGLTATPALHTREIFGDPVYTYSYREAVIDGWLIDHEPPYRFVTDMNTGGIHLEKGEEVGIIAPSGTVDTAQLPDELNFDIDDFNKKVIAPGFTKVICAEMAKELDPDSDQKTLIFCVTDRHADEVVQALKTALRERYPAVDDDAVMKITGASDKPMERIRRFKNERLPAIVVTVDLLTTGVDVPTICNLVFLRRVRSRILYEQMLGRATRLCRDIGKEAFRIYDAVDIYSSLEPFTPMKPVVTTVTVPLATLVEEIGSAKAHEMPGSKPDTSYADDLLDQLVARIRRRARKAVSKQDLSPEWLDTVNSLETLAGCSLDDLPGHLKKLGADGTATLFKAKPTLLNLLESVFRQLGGNDEPVYVTGKDDVFRGIERGYGPLNLKPADYLDAFKDYILTHQNEVPALIVVTQRPRDLSRKDLRELKAVLDAAGYSETALRSAYRDMTNQDIAASIIGFIRQKALGSHLIPYEQRVDRALERIKAMRPWKGPQIKWLEKIAKQYKKEIIVDAAALNEDSFLAAGGFQQIDKQLDGHLEEVITSLGDAIWDDSVA